MNRFAGEDVGAVEEDEEAGGEEGDKQLPPRNVRWKPRPGNEAERKRWTRLGVRSLPGHRRSKVSDVKTNCGDRDTGPPPLLRLHVLGVATTLKFEKEKKIILSILLCNWHHIVRRQRYDVSFNFDHQIKTNGTPGQCSVVSIHDEIGL